jgi:UDP-N-acetylglucosamine--N-acetylmuramyl-(pentapeptide) pyrophosphoryl-undecaprenol N-acetylglucosamine transferase
MVAGGTGGHIFPALAVAEELRARGAADAPYTIEFLGTHRPLEAKLIPAAGFRLRAVDAAGLKGIGGVQRLRNLMVLPCTAIEVARILREFRPHVVLGVGGYLAGPVMLEAALAGIPTILIEPNARPGFTNRLLAPFVRAAALGFAETAHVYGKKAHATGLPVRRAFFEIPLRQHTGSITILVVGGSQGSRAINQAVVETLPLLVADVAVDVAPGFSPAPAGLQVGDTSGAGLKPGATASATPGATSVVAPQHTAFPAGIRIIHQTGEHDYNEVRQAYQEQGVLAEVHAFIQDMPGALAQADLVISRAGATAVAELAAAGRASILIPFPGATDQHQLENARAMERAGAARVIVQSELTPERLVEEVRGLMKGPEMLAKMEPSARRLARPDAAARIADMVEALAGE